MIKPVIRFRNEIGYSEWSEQDLTEFEMQDIPHTPEFAPSRVNELTIGYQIAASYLELYGE
jgi:hypothetical protein